MPTSSSATTSPDVHPEVPRPRSRTRSAATSSSLTSSEPLRPSPTKSLRRTLAIASSGRSTRSPRTPIPSSGRADFGTPPGVVNEMSFQVVLPGAVRALHHSRGLSRLRAAPSSSRSTASSRSPWLTAGRPASSQTHTLRLFPGQRRLRRSLLRVVHPGGRRGASLPRAGFDINFVKLAGRMLHHASLSHPFTAHP